MIDLAVWRWRRQRDEARRQVEARDALIRGYIEDKAMFQRYIAFRDWEWTHSAGRCGDPDCDVVGAWKLARGEK